MAKSWSKLSGYPVHRISRAVAVMAIAMAAGHLVQTMAERKAPPVQAAVSLPTKIVALSASPEESGIKLVPDLAAKPLDNKSLTAKHIFLPAPVKTEPVVAQMPDCTLGLTAEPLRGAVVALTLHAPCDGGARVVLAHAGLTVTERLGLDGVLEMKVPALDQDGRFEVRLTDGRTVRVDQPVPELAKMKRFAVQWLGLDGFILHGFENGADFGQPGDVSAIQAGIGADAGSLMELGEIGVDSPLMAQVYTFPANGTADVVVEAPVTAANCAQDMLGQTISSLEGVAQVVDLTLAMPDCSAVGDFLVLKNLAPDMKVASK